MRPYIPSHTIKGTAITITLLAIVGFVGIQIIGPVTSEQTQANAQKATEWCAQENGELMNSNVLGNHGGLHCKLDDGTTIHMHKIADLGWTHDMATIQSTAGAMHGNTDIVAFAWQAMGLLFVGFTILFFAYFALAFAHMRGSTHNF